MPTPVLRFAPSPNGPLHLGHALSALEAQRWSTRLEGRLLLRIEDIDIARCRPEFETAILDDLTWLGVAHETPPRRQSEHFGDHAAAIATLSGMGLLYPCYATRGEIAAAVQALGADWPRDPDGAPLYPGLHRDLSEADRARFEAEGRRPALRLDMRRAAAMAGPVSWRELDDDGRPRRVDADPGRWGDVVVRRKDVPTSYHLAVVVDDAMQGVTHVTRGRDLFEATAVHRLLQALLGLPEPDYAHHRLVLGPDGRKLSKSRGDTGLRELRAAGATPADIRRMVGFADA